MCMKFFFRDLNPNSYLSRPTNIYTYRMSIAAKVYGDATEELLFKAI